MDNDDSTKLFYIKIFFKNFPPFPPKSVLKNERNIFLTGSSNQFQNYEFKYPQIFWQFFYTLYVT